MIVGQSFFPLPNLVFLSVYCIYLCLQNCIQILVTVVRTMAVGIIPDIDIIHTVIHLIIFLSDRADMEFTSCLHQIIAHIKIDILTTHTHTHPININITPTPTMSNILKFQPFNILLFIQIKSIIGYMIVIGESLKILVLECVRVATLWRRWWWGVWVLFWTYWWLLVEDLVKYPAFFWYCQFICTWGLGLGLGLVIVGVYF